MARVIPGVDIMDAFQALPFGKVILYLKNNILNGFTLSMALCLFVDKHVWNLLFTERWFSLSPMG